MMDEMLRKSKQHIDGSIYIFTRDSERKEEGKLIFMALVRPSNNFCLIELSCDVVPKYISV
jgi:hypothetical protein